MFVAEADESDGSFLLLPPDVAIVTNVEPDHLDHYGHGDARRRRLRRVRRACPAAGFLVGCVDDPGGARLATVARARARVVTYGLGDAPTRIADVRLDGARSSFEVVSGGVRLGRVELAVPGRHNVLNAVAALAPRSVSAPRSRACATGSPRTPAPAAGSSPRARPGECGSTTTTPTTRPSSPRDLARASSRASAALVVVLPAAPLLPHRGVRPETAPRSPLADDVVVMEVYAAGEDPVPGCPAGWSPPPCRCPPRGPSSSRPGRRSPARWPPARPGDVVLTLGAGDVTMIGPELLALLERPLTTLPRSPRASERPTARARSRRRVPRRQWRAGWLAWRSVLASCCWSRWWSAASGWVVLRLAADRPHVEVRGESPLADSRCAPPPQCPTASRSRSSTSRAIRSGRRPWRPSADVDVSPRLAARVLIAVVERDAVAVVASIGGGYARLDPDRCGLPRRRDAAAGAAARRRHRRPGSAGLAEVLASSPPCRPGWPHASTSRVAGLDQDSG